MTPPTRSTTRNNSVSEMNEVITLQSLDAKLSSLLKISSKTADEIKNIKQEQKEMNKSIEMCHNQISEINKALTNQNENVKSLEKKLISLENENMSLNSKMVAMEEKIGTISTNCTDDMCEEIISEINSRNSRKCNLVFFGVDEPNQNLSPQAREEADKTKIVNLLNVVLPEENFLQVKPIRIGQYNQNKKRIIKITLANEDMVISVLRNSFQLKNNQSFKSISISQDRTPRQIEYFKKIKAQMMERINNGENCRLKYINGVPKIINLN